ncbi:gamma-glutamylcyclotransferase [Curtobacterium flaccumfaciens]|nr:gamma-glutamylcyclotransferase [Curtobacterium flaccumfaciens]
MKRLSPGQRWVIGLGTFAMVCLVVGIVAIAVGVANGNAMCGPFDEDGVLEACPGDTSGIVWAASSASSDCSTSASPGSLERSSGPRPRRSAEAGRAPAPVAGATHRVFSYGTLRQPLVQESLFGDHVPTEPDALPGWRLDWVTITDPDVIRTSGSDRHPILRRGTPEDRVDGSYLVLGYEWQLRAVDDYEVADYQRIEVTLASGTTAWVYVAAEDA